MIELCQLPAFQRPTTLTKPRTMVEEDDDDDDDDGDVEDHKSNDVNDDTHNVDDDAMWDKNGSFGDTLSLIYSQARE